MRPTPHRPLRIQAQAVPLFLVALGLALLPARPAAGAESGVAGTWSGKLQQTLRLVLHLEAGPDGAISGTLDSPDQGATGIPLGTIVARGDSLFVPVPSLRSEYVGRLISPDSLAGEWRQSGMHLPLALSRGVVEPAPRPQEPRGALPYDAKDVQIETGAGGPRLAGTLTMPRASGKHPAVLLVSGSGPQDRNEEVFGHKPFLVIADHLTRQGIAVLRVDDRGIGGSTGKFADATSDDFARDAQACVAWLRGRKGIDPNQVGLIGHSEGALIAPIVAGRDPGLAFVILLAGPATDGEAVILDQAARMRRAAGVDPATIERLMAQQKRVFAILREVTDTTAAESSTRIRTLVRESLDMIPAADRAQIGDPDAYVERMLQTVASPWFRFFLSHDPELGLAAMGCPALALFGEKDVQVSPELHRDPMERALGRSGQGDVTVKVLPGLNHMFQPAETGLPAEYMQIEQTFDPAALELMSTWILERFGPGARAGGK